jgi:hypothetical protein
MFGAAKAALLNRAKDTVAPTIVYRFMIHSSLFRFADIEKLPNPTIGYIFPLHRNGIRANGVSWNQDRLRNPCANTHNHLFFGGFFDPGVVDGLTAVSNVNQCKSGLCSIRSNFVYMKQRLAR